MSSDNNNNNSHTHYNKGSFNVCTFELLLLAFESEMRFLSPPLLLLDEWEISMACTENAASHVRRCLFDVIVERRPLHTPSEWLAQTTPGKAVPL